MESTDGKTGSRPELGRCRVSIGEVSFTVHGGLTEKGNCVTCGCCLIGADDFAYRRHEVSRLLREAGRDRLGPISGE